MLRRAGSKNAWSEKHDSNASQVKSLHWWHAQTAKHKKIGNAFLLTNQLRFSVTRWSMVGKSSKYGNEMVEIVET